MAVITRRHGKINLLLAGVVVMTCDTLGEAREWMEVFKASHTRSNTYRTVLTTQKPEGQARKGRGGCIPLGIPPWHSPLAFPLGIPPWHSPPHPEGEMEG